MPFFSPVRSLPGFNSRRSARRKGPQAAGERALLPLCPPSCPMGLSGALGRAANRLRAEPSAARPRSERTRAVGGGVRLGASVLVDRFDGGGNGAEERSVDGEREERAVLLRVVHAKERDLDVYAAKFD